MDPKKRFILAGSFVAALIVLILAFQFLIPASSRLHFRLNNNIFWLQLSSRDDREPVKYLDYPLEPGDTLWDIGKKTGLSMDTLVSVNRLEKVHNLRVGQKLRIPHLNGLLYTTRSNETLASVASNHGVALDQLLYYNRLPKRSDAHRILQSGSNFFLPGASYSLEERMERFGTELLCPMSRGTFMLTAGYGWRVDPITRGRAFHRGVDLGSQVGTTVYSALGGTVLYATFDYGYGQFIAIAHKKGYVTRYAHLSRMYVHGGQQISAQTPIGAVGVTGRTTGPHLHFEVMKDGVTIDPRDVTDLR